MLYMGEDKFASNQQHLTEHHLENSNTYSRIMQNVAHSFSKCHNSSTSKVKSLQQNSSPNRDQNSSLNITSSVCVQDLKSPSSCVQQIEPGSGVTFGSINDKLAPDKCFGNGSKNSIQSNKYVAFTNDDVMKSDQKKDDESIDQKQPSPRFPVINCDIVNSRSEKVISSDSSCDYSNKINGKHERSLPVLFSENNNKPYYQKPTASPKLSKANDLFNSSVPSHEHHQTPCSQHCFQNPSNLEDLRKFKHKNAELLDSQANSHLTNFTSSSPNLAFSSEEFKLVKKSVVTERIKYVSLLPNLAEKHKQSQLSGAVLCEQLFGIILCHYNSKSSCSFNGSARDKVYKERKIIVRDIVLGSVAEKCNQIHRGDMLISVNDIDVSWMNLQDILGAIGSNVVKLTFQEPVLVGPGKHTLLQQHVPTKGSLVQQLLKQNVTDILPSQEKYFYAAMYLSLDSVSLNDEEISKDVIYQFPSENSKLTELKGLYLTLNSILTDITDDIVKQFPLCACEIIIKDLACLIKVLFGSFTCAFRESLNRENLDELYALTFYRLFCVYDSLFINNQSEIETKLFLDCLAGIQCLNLTEENKVICDEFLSDFESADFDNLELPYERRRFNIIASSLYYKDYLIATHLPKQYLRCLHLFLKYHCVLQSTSKRQTEDIILWRQIYPSETPIPSEPKLIGYTASVGRTFLLLVSVNNFLTATVLEAGVYSSLEEDNSQPDQFLIDELKTLMKQLESEDVSMAECCEERLLSETDGPSLVSADMVMVNLKSRKEDIILSASPLKKPQTPSKTSTPFKTPTADYKKKGSPQIDGTPAAFEDDASDLISGESSETSTPMMHRHGSKMSNGSNDSGGSGGSFGNSRAKITRSLFDMSNIGKSLFGLQEEDGNVSSHTKLPQLQMIFALQFSEQVRKAQLSVSPKDSQKSLKFGEKCCQPFYEQGVLFQFSTQSVSPEHRKSHPSDLKYWVLGRYIPQPCEREFYICIHESIHQGLVEAVFKFHFGY